ncbi:MAG TPA: BamA/TamA family outer membrane protein [Tenuifilaceae bacterium]|nr:BamA/TamA family outer membrane protein [Tenuifilaceae bacterium]
MHFSKVIKFNTVFLLFTVIPFLGKAISDTVRVDSVKTPKNYFLVLPVAFYGEETNLGLGFSGGYYHVGRGNKISNVQGNVAYTLNNQFLLSFSPRIYTKSEDYFYSGRVKANYFPDKFYGIGRDAADSMEESFTSKELSVLIQRQRIMFGVLMAGVQAQFEYVDAADIDPNGQLVTGITGVDKSIICGLGIVLTWDNRENQFYPTTGEFYKASLMANSRIFGSDLNFTRLTIDLRNYYKITDNQVFAVQFLGDLTWGNVPFQEMPMLGGADVLRGYYKGRYRDKTMICAQGEYRFPIYRWLKGVAFASAGDVASYFDKIDLTKIKSAFGTGLRFRVNPIKVNIRFDAAYSLKRSPAYYLTVTEAF